MHCGGGDLGGGASGGASVSGAVLVGEEKSSGGQHVYVIAGRRTTR